MVHLAVHPVRQHRHRHHRGDGVGRALRQGPGLRRRPRAVALRLLPDARVRRRPVPTVAARGWRCSRRLTGHLGPTIRPR